MATFRLEIAGQTERGTTRGANQDNFRIFEAPQAVACAVADGMGGKHAGALAAELATLTLTSFPNLPRLSSTEDRIRRAFVETHRVIFEASESTVDLRGMGAMAALVVIQDDVAHLAHVGTCRVYRLRGASFDILTRDHSLENYVLDQRASDPLIAAHGDELRQYKHIVLRAFGLSDAVETEVRSEPLEAGDVLLLCTDGLWRALYDRRIEAILRESIAAPQRAVQTLIDEALDEACTTRDGEYWPGDDVAAIVIRVSMGRS